MDAMNNRLPLTGETLTLDRLVCANRGKFKEYTAYTKSGLRIGGIRQNVVKLFAKAGHEPVEYKRGHVINSVNGVLITLGQSGNRYAIDGVWSDDNQVFRLDESTPDSSKKTTIEQWKYDDLQRKYNTLQKYYDGVSANVTNLQQQNAELRAKLELLQAIPLFIAGMTHNELEV